MPLLYKQWISTVVEYIRENYKTPVEGDSVAGHNTDPVEVDAIVGPDTRGFVFALTVANNLNLPFVPIHQAGEIPTDPNDVIQTIHVNRKQKVIFY